MDEPFTGRANANALANQARVRRWLDAITRANLIDHPPPDDVLADIDSALEDYRIISIPTARSPGWKPVRFVSGYTPDDPARLAVMMRDVLLAGLHTRLTKCELKECEKFVFTPTNGRGRLQRYCGKTHKNRHNRRKNS